MLLEQLKMQQLKGELSVASRVLAPRFDQVQDL